MRCGGFAVPADEEGLQAAHSAAIVGHILLVLAYILQIRRVVAATGQIHLIMLALGMAAGLELASAVLEYISLAAYSSDGRAHVLFATQLPAVGNISLPTDFAATVLGAGASAVMMSLFVSLASGWTLAPPDGGIFNQHRARRRRWITALVISSYVVCVCVCVCARGAGCSRAMWPAARIGRGP
jgi:hypothetical protein